MGNGQNNSFRLLAEASLNKMAPDSYPQVTDWLAVSDCCVLGLCSVAFNNRDTTMPGTSALIGYTGFVGSHIAAGRTFSDYFNSRNIHKIRNKQYDLVVCAGTPGLKWEANKRPEQDSRSINKLTENLMHTQCDVFVLVSTISVYPSTVGAIDESTDVEAVACSETATEVDIFSKGYTAYGKHRGRLEAWLRQRVISKQIRCGIVLRLPAVFGTGLKKNYVWDLLTQSEYLHKVDLASYHQWYDLGMLPADLDAVIAHSRHREKQCNVYTFNLFPEPVQTRTIVNRLFPDLISQCKQESNQPGFIDDVKTHHKSLWKSIQGYRYGQREVLERLEKFCLQWQRWRDDKVAGASTLRSKL